MIWIIINYINYQYANTFNALLPFSWFYELNNFNEIKKKPELIISFTDVKANFKKEFSPIIKSKSLSILKNSTEDKKKLWSKIKEYKDGALPS